MTLTPDPYQTAVLKAANHRRRDVLNLFFDNFDANKRTVILLPGGAGSALYRADQKFDEADPTEYTYKQVWLTPGILPRAIGDGKNLPISKNGRDLSDYVIVTDGDVEWFVLPYLKAMRVFRANCNAVLLGWDWRRDTSGTGEHMTLMAQDYVLRCILEIVSGSTLTEDQFIAEHGQNPQMATPEELKEFMNSAFPKIRSRNLKSLSSRNLEREIATLIPDKYLWRILQETFA